MLPRLFTSMLAVLSLSLPLVNATAAGQYHLNVNSDVSSCFWNCHVQTTRSIPLPSGQSNSFEFVSLNCEYPLWSEYISQCIALQCASPADVAYAMEYGVNFCRRGGVTVNFTLPEMYLDSVNGTYFQSDAYLNSATRSGTNLGIGLIIAGVAAAMMI
ncbi:hypothetical protein M231_00065 [Tremella mesenterica]|uniref:Extracellular membrane protein CFEM domain-containing protein n=1 Tax=Tremella mesenterica TaxID=5217 RepID=A0A4Q1BWG2_TREME|nr:uncharacterized protein TREMEDRAFT_72890 [Tremella mesenterica DSM 1558]EIW72813.1 hypothetical protein TREMEDRAFT_72890 [Tremella mesenterica DSM 1558]RXK42511.1 hypothetical protein M231_00065 [Tremella mesenterica]